MNKNKGILVATLVIIALLAVVAVTGADLGFVEIPSVERGVTLGLDLVGGSAVTFEAQIPNDVSAADASDGMNAAVELLRKRLDALGYSEAQISRVGERRIRVEIPNISDPEEAVEKLGQTAELTFRDADGNVVLGAGSVESVVFSTSAIDETNISTPHAVLTFKPEYRQAFTDATRDAANRPEGENFIAVYLDENMQSAPAVDSKYASTGIDSDSCVVTFGSGGDAAARAREFVNLVNIGKLPYKLEAIQLSAVGAQLGEKSLNTSLLAGGIGLLLVIIFMIAIYRLPGVTAGIALVGYVAIIAVVMAVTHVNLSLPGIAGLILGIGMAVDANVVIFERIMEELRSGKTVRSSVDSGYHRALTAIIDSNITTLIAAVVLWWQGTGPIQGFAVTLFISVVASMFTALVVTRILLGNVTGMNITNLRAFGLSKEVAK